MKLQILTSLLGLAGLAGCSTMAPGTQSGPSTLVAAAPLQTPAMSVSESMYAMARQAHSQGQLAMAAQRYERVLAIKPDHVGALNALGVIRAQDGRTAEALDLLVHARNLAPSAAYVHNNLGYVLLKEERLGEAQVSLRVARELDPSSVQTLQNLELLAQARARRDGPQGAQTDRDLPVAENGAAEQVAAVVPVANNVFELRLPGPAQATPAALAAVVQPAVETASVVPDSSRETGFKLVLSRELAMEAAPFAIWTDIRGVRIEVSNGVGITRLAKRTADRLAQEGIATSRLTNARPYRQERTQIQYVAGQQNAVKALAARLPMHVEQVQVSQLNPSVQLRLVLGHDVAGRAIAAWIDGPPIHLAKSRSDRDRPA